MNLNNNISSKTGKDLEEDQYHQASTSDFSGYPTNANDDILKGLFGIEYADCAYNLSSPIQDEVLKNNLSEMSSEDLNKQDGTCATKTWNNKGDHDQVDTVTTSYCSTRNSFRGEVCDVAEEEAVDAVHNVTNDDYEEAHNSAFCVSTGAMSSNEPEKMVSNLGDFHCKYDCFPLMGITKESDKVDFNAAMSVDNITSEIEAQFSSGLQLRDEMSLDLCNYNDKEGKEMTHNDQVTTDLTSSSGVQPSSELIDLHNNGNQLSPVSTDQFEENLNVTPLVSQATGSPGAGPSSAPNSMSSLPASITEFYRDLEMSSFPEMDQYMNTFYNNTEYPSTGTSLATAINVRVPVPSAGTATALNVSMPVPSARTRKKRVSKREAARAASRAEQRRERMLAELANKHQISDDQLLRLRPKKQRRAARFEKPVPSRFCHVCSRTPKNVQLTVCSNIRRGICRKVVCEKCFIRYGYGDFNKAKSGENEFLCPHCCNVCPGRAQCGTYQRINDRLRVNRLKQGTPKCSKIRRSRRRRDGEDPDNTLAIVNNPILHDEFHEGTNPPSPTGVSMSENDYLNDFNPDSMEH